MLYTSPEQESGGSYHHSADMFSLGIVFFEMWCPFDSMMGRAKSLQALRDTNTVPEKSFPEDDPLGEKVKKITEYLIARDPASRPSAEQLLQSPFVPVSLDMDQGYLRAALQAVRDPDSGFFQTLLRRVFNKWVPEHLDYIFEPQSRQAERDSQRHACCLDITGAFDGGSISQPWCAARAYTYVDTSHQENDVGLWPW
jgi:translation initiation factor 2-alpha kinase 4